MPVPGRGLLGLYWFLAGGGELVEQARQPVVCLVDPAVSVPDGAAAVTLDVGGLLGEHGVDGASERGEVGLAALNGLADGRGLRLKARVALIRELPRGEPLGVEGWSLRLALAELLRLRDDRGLPALEGGQHREDVGDRSC